MQRYIACCASQFSRLLFICIFAMCIEVWMYSHVGWWRHVCVSACVTKKLPLKFASRHTNRVLSIGLRVVQRRRWLLEFAKNRSGTVRNSIISAANIVRFKLLISVAEFYLLSDDSSYVSMTLGKIKEAKIITHNFNGAINGDDKNPHIDWNADHDSCDSHVVRHVPRYQPNTHTHNIHCADYWNRIHHNFTFKFVGFDLSYVYLFIPLCTRRSRMIIIII